MEKYNALTNVGTTNDICQISEPRYDDHGEDADVVECFLSSSGVKLSILSFEMGNMVTSIFLLIGII